MATDIGTGTTLIVPSSSGTSASGAGVRDVRWSGIAYDFAESTDMATTTAKTFIKGDVYDPGTLEVDITFDPSVSFVFTATATTITVNWAGNTSNAWTASGFFTGLELNAPYQGTEVMGGTLTFKLSGVITQ